MKPWEHLLEADKQLESAYRAARASLNDRTLSRLVGLAKRARKHVRLSFPNKPATVLQLGRNAEADVTDISRSIKNWERLQNPDTGELHSASFEKKPPAGTQFFELTFDAAVAPSPTWWIIQELVFLGAVVSLDDKHLFFTG